MSSRLQTVGLVLPDVTVTLKTDRGVFSAGAVDRGTKLLLLEAPPPPPTGNVVDLGCGYGPIAVTLGRRAPGAQIWAVDVNARARELTAANAKAAGLENVTVSDPSALTAPAVFDAIYSNPPVRIGKAALHDLLAEWLGRLDGGGHAYLVVHKHLGSDSLSAWLAGDGWNVRRVVSRMGYRVLDVARAS